MLGYQGSSYPADALLTRAAVRPSSVSAAQAMLGRLLLHFHSCCKSNLLCPRFNIQRLCLQIMEAKYTETRPHEAQHLRLYSSPPPLKRTQSFSLERQARPFLLGPIVQSPNSQHETLCIYCFLWIVVEISPVPPLLSCTSQR